jgi:hypothetical protein
MHEHICTIRTSQLGGPHVEEGELCRENAIVHVHVAKVFEFGIAKLHRINTIHESHILRTTRELMLWGWM